jgi:heme exporter protein A
MEKLRCNKGQQQLFSNINCRLNAGELLHVTGENGSGKTTLLRILAGLNRDYEGDVQWCGQDIRRHWAVYAQQLIYLGHQPALKAQLTARENLVWYAACAGVNAASIAPALKTLGLHNRADLPCHQLSAGQQRRVVLARLMFSPQLLWILDEPFTAIDTKGFAPVVDCLRNHLARGGMAVLTTHHGMENIDLPHRALKLGEQNSLVVTG